MSRDIWVIDWKSGSGVYEEMKTQVSCYAKMSGSARAGVVRLDKITGELDDPPLVEVVDIDTRWEAFIHLREYFRRMIESNGELKRFYPYEDKRFPSITTILDILSKPALPQWSANMTIEYIKANLKEMTTPEQIEYHLKKAKTAFRTMSKVAMDTGSVVHDAIHAYLSGAKPEPILGDNDKAINSFLAFLEWNKEVQLEPIALEEVLIDPEIQIGGTVDFRGWANIE